MKGEQRVFVSFSGQDRGRIRDLFNRLRSQTFDTWDYSDEGEEVAFSADLAEALVERLGAANVMVVVVSNQSLGASWPTFELEEGLRRADLTILPVLIDPVGLADAAGPFCALASRRYVLIDPTDRAQVEHAVRRICHASGAAYRPLVVRDPRLPFGDRLVEEIASAVPRRSERELGIYDRVMQASDRFQLAFAADRLPEALRAVRLLIAACEVEYPATRFYYPYIAQAVCLVQSDRLVRAAQVLDQLRDGRRLDENFHTLVGVVAVGEGRFVDAIEAFDAGARVAPQEGGLHAWRVWAQLARGEEVTAAALDLLTTKRLHSRIDARRVEVIRLVALARRGAADAVGEALGAMLAWQPFDADGFASICGALFRCSAPELWLGLLEGAVGRAGEHVGLRRLRATAYLAVGDVPSAVADFSRLVEADPTSRALRVDLLVAQLRAGDRDGARAQAEAILSRCGPPTCRDDFYRDGLANWLVGRGGRADYDFERSGRPEAEHYAGVLAEVVG